MKLFELFGDVFVDDHASKTIDDIDKKSKVMTKTLTASAVTVAKWGAGLAAAAGVAGVALLKTSEKAAATTDRIDKLSQRLGLSRDGFQEWEFVLSQSGSSMESLQSGMKVMVQKMDDLKKGTGEG